MKYWLLTSEYPPFFGGGISTYCHFTARMLAANGHAVSVFVNDASVKDVLITQEDNVRIIRFNTYRTGSSRFLGHTTNISYEFAAIVKHLVGAEGKPDIIEAQEYLGIAYYLLQFKHLQYDWCRDIPVIITAHSPSFLYLQYNHVSVYRYPNYWIGEMERSCLHAADLVISPSQFLVDELKKQFDFTPKNIQVIVNPYEPDTKEKIEPANVQSNEIVFYGKLSVQKGTFKLLGYFSKLWTQGSELKLRLVGGQDIVYHPEGKTMGDIVKNKYKEFIKEGKLILENKILPAEINTRLNNARVVVIPSTVDNLPYVVLEMMGMGNIVLVSKQGGQAEIVTDGVDGFIFDHDHPETFFDQLNRILALTSDERTVIVANAKQKIRSNYSSGTVYKQKSEAINKLVNSDASRSLFPFIRPAQQVPASNIVRGTKDLLSVVVTFYNSGKYLDGVIQCIERSDYGKKEIIVVDDGSKDRVSCEKLEQYRNRQGVRIISKPNKGLADTRNVGAAAATGEFLTFLDADDIVDAAYYSKAISVLKKYENVHFAGAWTQYFEGSQQVWPTFNPEPPIILYHNMINSAALVCKRDSFLDAGQNDPSMIIPGLEDYDSIISLLSHGYNGVVLPELLFHYRVRPDSMVRGISTTKKLLIWQYISNKHRSFYSNFAADLFNLVNANGPGIAIDNPSLDYDLADKLPFGGKAGRKIIRFVKNNRHIRPLAYKVYRIFNK